MCARLYSPCSRTSIRASAERVSRRWTSVAAAISRGMAGAPRSAVVVLAEHVRGDGAALEVVAAALESDQVAAVHVDLHGRAIAEVVELMDLVRVRNQERDLAGLHEDGAVLLERRAALAALIVHPAESRLLDGVTHHADHSPGVMIVRTDVRAGPPHDARDGQPRPLVEEEAATARAAARGGGLPVALGHGFGIPHEPGDEARAAVEQRGLIGLPRDQVGHVVD